MTRAERPGSARPRTSQRPERAPSMRPKANESRELFAVGEVLNDMYEIRAFLGAGGMGQVFEAHDRVLNRRVAIKAAHDRSRTGLLLKEAQALAAVRHPSMVTVHAMGSHRGVDYIVMERVYGFSLDAHIESRVASGESFTVNEALDVLIAVAEGLAVVHRSGIAHRDVKPSNIMLAPANRIVLMDFGLVLPEFEVAAQTEVAGSPNYMAPEAILNAVEPGAGHLVDLYSLGVIAFRMLTGDVPFPAKTVSEVCEMHISAPVPDVSHHREGIPRELAALITSMLAKQPSARPATADSVALRLRRIREIPIAATSTARFSVLVVEDDPDMLKVLSFYVRKIVPHAEVRTAIDGERALEAVRSQAPDVMLLDLQMPGMNGIELCMYLRGTHFADGCTIVSVSAGAQPRDVELLRQLGITHFVAKGTDLRAQLTTVLTKLASA